MGGGEGMRCGAALSSWASVSSQTPVSVSQFEKSGYSLPSVWLTK